jgi:CopG family nickel-responsive transcriptional regulator
MEAPVMSKTVRFSVSLGEDLMRTFDRQWTSDGLATRSEAVKTMIRQAMVKRQWRSGQEVAGAIVLVYDHHERSLGSQLTDIQHDFEDVVVASQHAHLDHDNCLESIIVKGQAREIERFVQRLKSVKRLKHVEMMMTTTGQES